MKIKTSKLTGAALDWAVAKAASLSCAIPWRPDPFEGYGDGPVYAVPKFSTDWAQGCPLRMQKVTLREPARTNTTKVGVTAGIKPGLQQKPL